MPRTASPLPLPLVKAAERLDQWRQQRSGRRISEELWSLAATLAGRYGVNRTARALRLHYPDLKQRVARSRSLAAGSGRGPAFVEVPGTPAPAAAWTECR
ncbi:MAG: hypothetical protein HY812_19070 [Planctomycetes bacterium]|nr:hypothetical protein [Planctomycetota bacterium]